VTLAIANLAIIDTSVYINNLRSGRFQKELLELKFVVRASAVVLAVGRLMSERRYDDRKAKEIHFDVLIAMTARKIGAYLITCDADDFTAIHGIMDFNLICW